MQHRSSLVGLFVAVALALGFADAHAGHYRLPLANFVTVEETGALAKVGIGTTLALLEKVKTPEQRASLAKATGLAAERVAALACQVDLLRIDGIGPTVARLLNASGVRHTAALAAQEAGPLLARMKDANGAESIAKVLPQEAQVAAWVAAAQRLPRAIDGLE